MKVPSHVHVHIVSDIAQRDVDTSLALSNGMKQGFLKSLMARTTTVSFEGLEELKFAHDLFHPEREHCGRTAFSMVEDLTRQINERIAKLDDKSIEQVVDRIQKIGAIEKPWDLGLFDFQCPGQTGLKVRLVCQIAEMLLYSRAVGTDPPFCPSATEEDVYAILQMHDAFRAAMYLGNPLSLMTGLVKAKSILHALQKQNDNDDHHFTIFVGHDKDIDNVATALGLGWDLPSPYHQDGILGSPEGFLTTPPGSGLLFTSSDDADVTMSFLCPEFGDQPNHFLVPVYEKDWHHHKAGGNRTLVELPSTMEAMQRRIDEMIQLHPEFRQCYETASVHPNFKASDILELSSKEQELLVSFAVNIAVTLCMFIAAVYRCARSSSKTKAYAKVDLSPTNPEVEFRPIPVGSSH